MFIALVCALIAVTALLPVTAFLLKRQMNQARDEAYNSWLVATDFCQLTQDCARLLERVGYIYACDPDALAKAISTLSVVEQAHIKHESGASTIARELEKVKATTKEHSEFIGQSGEYATRPKPGEVGRVSRR
tara:strand:+ start:1385 stop:1783 length:399 start_codon:yes stop_codon:yes gene_type:complete